MQQNDPFSTIGDEDLIDGRTAKAFFQNYNDRFQNFASGVGEMYKGQLSMLEQNSKLLYPKIWEKYGKEIKDEIAELNKTKVITGDDYDRVISMIKGRHIDDFLEEKVQQHLQNIPPGDPGAPGAQGGAALQNQPNMPESWQKYLRDAGLTVRDIQGMLDRRRDNYGYAPSLEEYFKQMEQHQIIKDEKAYKTFDLIPENKK